MEEPSGLPAEPGSHEPRQVPSVPLFPAWVPSLIAAVLVVMAALAVYTGLHYRGNTMVRIVKPRPPARGSAAPPGEPQPGASLVFPGEAGDNAPAAGAPMTGASRAVVTNSAGALQSTVRIWARRGMILDVVPDDAIVSVNEVIIGQARQFNTPDETYDFPAPGSYSIRISAPGFRDRLFIVTASDEAKEEIARIAARLERE